MLQLVTCRACRGAEMGRPRRVMRVQKAGSWLLTVADAKVKQKLCSARKIFAYQHFELGYIWLLTQIVLEQSGDYFSF